MCLGLGMSVVVTGTIKLSQLEPCFSIICFSMSKILPTTCLLFQSLLETPKFINRKIHLKIKD